MESIEPSAHALATVLPRMQDWRVGTMGEACMDRRLVCMGRVRVSLGCLVAEETVSIMTGLSLLQVSFNHTSADEKLHIYASSWNRRNPVQKVRALKKTDVHDLTSLTFFRLSSQPLYQSGHVLDDQGAFVMGLPSISARPDINVSLPASWSRFPSNRRVYCWIFSSLQTLTMLYDGLIPR